MSRQATTLAGAPTGAPAATRWGALRHRCWLLLEPDANRSRASAAVDALLVTLICLSVVGIVLESVDALYRRHRSLFDGLEAMTVAVFTVEYLLRVWTAVEHPRARAWRGGGALRRLRYAATPDCTCSMTDRKSCAPSS